MYQSSPDLDLAIQITPSELAYSPSNQLALMDSEDRVGSESRLLLRPGELNQVFIQLANRSKNTLTVRLEFQVSGYFPTDWFRIQPEEQQLEPGVQVDASIDFQLPENFLEEPIWLGKTPSAELEYQASLYAWSVTDQSTQLLESRPFPFAVRPHSLYLKFLPALYSDVDFIGRFLSIFEKTFEPSVQTLESLWAYLDPLTAPKSLLPFLAEWVAWPMDDRWDLAQQRHLIQNAVNLYRWRGTRKGLRLYLHLYTGLPLDEHLPESNKHISIEEVLTEGFVLGPIYMGQDTMLGGGRPFHFIVRLRPDYPHRVDVALVKSIIEREKPAFCSYELYVEEQSPLYISEPTILEF
jgi:phage tail-like protein